MNPALHIGTWRVYPDLGLLRGPAGEVGLEPKAMAVLVYLAHRPGQVISADDLIGAIWNNRPMGDNPVYKCIAQLRKALGDNPAVPAYIATIPKKGYRLVAPVAPAGEAPRQPPQADRSRGWRPGRAAVLATLALAAASAALAYLFNAGDPGTDSGMSRLQAGAQIPPPGPYQVSGCTGTTRIEACQRYLLAHEHLRQQAPDFKPRAIDLLQQATAVDPAFAAAQASLARLYLMPGDEYPWHEARLMAETALTRALELDERLGEAHAVRGLLHMTDARGPCPPGCLEYRGYAQAEADLRYALTLQPGMAFAHNWLAIALAGQGELGLALQELRTGLMHDPLNPAINHNLAYYTMQMGNPDDARRQVATLLDRHPNPPRYMYGMLARIADAFGRYDESLRHAQELVDNPATSPFLATVLHACLQLGFFEEADRLLENYERVPLLEIHLWAQQQLPMMTGDHPRLAELDHRVMARAADYYGPRRDWPRWLLKSLGRSQSLLGQHDTAVELLGHVYDGPAPGIDHLRFLLEIDTLHALATSLRALGDERRAEALLDHSHALITARQELGHGSFPDLTYAEARTHLLHGRHGLAIATLRQAVSQGWRRLAVLEADPRWTAVAVELDFRQIVSVVDAELAVMRRGAGGGANVLARVEQPD